MVRAQALTIVAYNVTNGRVVSRVPMVDTSLPSFYSLFFDDHANDLKCVLMEDNTGVYSKWPP